jgi:ligand-binding SRPBCC domain-containing protein
MPHILTTAITLPLPRAEVFAFFADAQNLSRITPNDLSFDIVSPLPITMRAGAIIDYVIKLHGLPMRWRTEITEWEEGRMFVDVQRRGPYALWEHRHSLIDVPGGTRIDDEVRYALPFGALGDLAHVIVRRQLTGIFTFRQAETARLLLGDRAAEASIAPVRIT